MMTCIYYQIYVFLSMLMPSFLNKHKRFITLVVNRKHLVPYTCFIYHFVVIYMYIICMCDALGNALVELTTISSLGEYQRTFTSYVNYI